MGAHDDRPVQQADGHWTWLVETPSGAARVHHYRVDLGRPRATLVLGHGAGRGPDAVELLAIAEALPGDGVEVLLVEQPWHVAGRRLAGPAGTLDAAWLSVTGDLRGRGIGARRLVVGGRSTGARVACRTVADVEPAALLLLAFPLRPARRSPLGDSPSRLPELVAAASAVPCVVVQGTRDRMGSAEEIAVSLADAEVTARVVPIAGADHSFALPRAEQDRRGEAMALIVRAARATALRLVAGPY